jgi:hypothetical protein
LNNDDELLTLEEARAISRYKSVRTLRRAYTRGDLAIVQPVPGGPVKVWRSELLRWLNAPRPIPTTSTQLASSPPARSERPRKSATLGTSAKATATRSRVPRPEAARCEPAGAPPRLSLAEVSAA